MSCHLLMCLATLVIGRAAAYPDGAPEGTCGSMMPFHYSVKGNTSVPLQTPSTLPVYFTILINKDKVQRGDTIEVTIRADKNYFEGFSMQVREVKVETNLTSARKFGKFKVTNDDAKLMCNEQGITHAKHFKWNTTTLTWIAPNEEVSNLQFRATVVKGYREFFVDVNSPVFSVTGAGMPVVPAPLLLLIVCCLHIFKLSL
ncbi:putative defense protein 3 [Physella acuta]|uniref:putative defense protein 3 n=1 Tax=Physella acuta TaxID=109671 RepID=UPI0027DBEBCA|nr:putative defense protein 3 [Physella acuta]